MLGRFKKFIAPEKVNEVLNTVLDEKIREKNVAERFSKNGMNFFFIVILMLVYIANGYSMEKLQREQNRLEREANELRVRSISVNAELMQLQKASSVLKRVRDSGIPLKQSSAVPIKLYK